MNERAIRLQRQWEKADNDQVAAAVQALLEHEHGRKFLWWLLQIGRVGTQPFSNNALTTSFACGELNVGQQVLAKIIEVNPAGYVRMMEESNDERNIRDIQLNSAAKPDDGGSDDHARGHDADD